ncbi:MAG: galactose mutarotase [Opitutales bacterium]|nr:galactose mutarotase [Opitutales bacterium]
MLTVSDFGKFEGEAVKLYTLTNAAGFTAAFCDLGATWVRWLVPARNGVFEDVVLGFDSAEAYARQTAYVGAVCGRHANRIAGGKFKLCGNDYSLAVNNGPNHLHGGLKGFNSYIWTATCGGNDEEPSVRFTRLSPDGEEGYPGNLQVSVTYTLLKDGAVRLDYKAETDKTTLINLTNHSYFNLAGHASGTVLAQYLTLRERGFLPTDEVAIPTGEVWATNALRVFDFSQPKALGDCIFDKRVRQLIYGKGYDHCFILGGNEGVLREVAKLECRENGRVMTVETTEPAMQVYTGNWLGDCCAGVPAKDGVVYGDYAGVAFETQHAPDAINQNAFRANILQPGTPYVSTTIYRPSIL